MTRLHGLDLARALALIGMMAAHLGPSHPVTNGYPSVLFAVLAGVSMGIISARTPEDLPTTRFRLLLRGVILVGLGTVLSLVQSGIVEVLTAIGVCYVLLIPVVNWRIRRLAILLAVLVVGGPLLVAADNYFVISWGDHEVAELLTGAYPLLAWLAYLLVGLLIHRLVGETAVGSAGRQVWLAATGLALLVGTQLIMELTDFRVAPGDILNPIGAYLQGEPHSGGVLDVLGSAGAAMMVIGACLLACRVDAVVWVGYPLRALGSMSLTVYLVHVVITALSRGTFLSVGSIYEGRFQSLPKEDFGWTMYTPHTPLTDAPAGAGEVFEPGSLADPSWLWMFAAQMVGLLIFSSLWRWRFRRGPLEWGVHRVIENSVGSSPRPVS